MRWPSSELPDILISGDIPFFAFKGNRSKGIPFQDHIRTHTVLFKVGNDPSPEEGIVRIMNMDRDHRISNADPGDVLMCLPVSSAMFIKPIFD